MADYIFLLETRLSASQQAAVRLLLQHARAAGLNLYLTGGPMRDLLTGKPVLYLNFTTEGAPQPLAKPLAAAGAEHVTSLVPERIVRCTLYQNPVRIAGALAATPGKNGRIVTAPGTIVDDLRRRGLSLNSIGLSLNEGSRGLLLDPTNGVADIEARLIRMNGPYVFFEEPVTLLRAVRLRARLGFEIEERTAARMASAREGNYIANAESGALGLELEAIAYEPDPATVLRQLDTEGLLAEAFGGAVRAAKMKLHALAQLPETLAAWTRLGVHPDAGRLAMPLILGGLATADQNRLTAMLTSKHLADWKSLPKAAAALEKKVAAARDLTAMHTLVRETVPDTLVFASLAASDAKAGRKLKEYEHRALELQQRLPRNTLRQGGLDPESAAGAGLLEELFGQLLAGGLKEDAALIEAARVRVLALRPPPPEPKPRAAGQRTVPGKASQGKTLHPAKWAAAPAKPAAEAAKPAPAAPPAPATPVAKAVPAKTPKAAAAKPEKPAPAKAAAAKTAAARPAPKQKPAAKPKAKPTAKPTPAARSSVKSKAAVRRPAPARGRR